MGGCLTVMAFEVKSVNGTNMSSPANPSNHREITRCPGGHSLHKLFFFFFKNTAEQSGPHDEVEKRQSLVMGRPI